MLALLLAIAAGCGGTLMLLTDETPTATNVMTAGDAEIGLHEVVNPEPDNHLTEKSHTVTDTAITASLGAIKPGQTIVKMPAVTNNGTTDVYVAVELIFWTTGSAVDRNDTEALRSGFFSGINFTETNSRWAKGIAGWTGTAPEGGYRTWHEIYFYKNESNNSLTRLPGTTNPEVQDISEPVFDKILIPETWDNEIDNVGFNLAVKAYAIQADYVTPGNTTGAWQQFFAGKFTNIDYPPTPAS
jgi:hypothetical protein